MSDTETKSDGLYLDIEDSSSDSDSDIHRVRAPSNELVELIRETQVLPGLTDEDMISSPRSGKPKQRQYSLPVKVEEIDFKWKELFGAYFDDTKEYEDLVDDIDWTALLLQAAEDATGMYEPTKIARIALKWKHEGYKPSRADFFKWSNNEIGSFLATIAQLAGQILYLNFSSKRKTDFRGNIDTLKELFDFDQSSSTKVRLHWYRLSMLVYGEPMMEELAGFLRQHTRNHTIEDLLLNEHSITALSIEDRSVGCLFGALLGDVLGAALEGDSAARISRFHPKGVRDFLWSPHMNIYHLPPRYGYYTEDTNSILSVADSLVQHQRLDPQLMAENYAKFWKREPERGYPDATKKIMNGILEGCKYDETDESIISDNICNGGPVRIPPIGIAFRNASPEQLRHACQLAIRSTHTRTESIDGACVLANAVRYLLSKTVVDFSGEEFLKECHDFSELQQLKDMIQLLLDRLGDKDTPHSYESDINLLDNVGGMIFQSSTCHALPDALWAFVRFYDDPVQCLVNTVGFGGDTDTVACMAGALVGALHGTRWIPKRWHKHTENGEQGREYCIKTGIELAKLDLSDS